MNNTRCAECSFVNFLDAVVCKRCGNFLNRNRRPASFVKSPETTEDFTNENRQIGWAALVLGIISSIAPWVLTFKLQIVYGKLNALLVVCGLPFVIIGLGAITDPPKSKLNADENKNRNGALFLSGLLLGLIEACFFNQTLGIW